MSRSAERDAEARAQLTPLAAGERPLGLKLGAALALLIGLANVVGVIAGVGENPALGLVFAAVMLAAAVGLWMRNYAAVLAFQALLAVGIIYAALSLALAGNVLAVLFSLLVIGVCSPIFWLLVRVMARLQVPRG